MGSNSTVGYSAVVFRQGRDDYPVDALAEVRLGNAAMIGHLSLWARQNLPSDAVLTRIFEKMGSGAALPLGDLPQLGVELGEASGSGDPDVRGFAKSFLELIGVAAAEGATISFV